MIGLDPRSLQECGGVMTLWDRLLSGQASRQEGRQAGIIGRCDLPSQALKIIKRRERRTKSETG